MGLKNLIHTWSRAKNIFLDFLYPKICVRCRKEGSYFCQDCQLRLRFNPRPADPAEPWGLFSYQDPALRRLIWLLKYRGAAGVAQILGDLTYQSLVEELSMDQFYHPQSSFWLVIPVPLAPRRRHKRGFNQAELIARFLAENDSKHFRLVTGVLIKIKETLPQVGKKRSERLANLSGAFRLQDRRRLRGKSVILIDDVATTGATLTECEKILRSGKPFRIIKIAVAGS